MEIQVFGFFFFGFPTAVLGLVCAAATPDVFETMAEGEPANFSLIKRVWIRNFLMTGFWIGVATLPVTLGAVLSYLGLIAPKGIVMLVLQVPALGTAIPLASCLLNTFDLYLQLMNCFRDPKAPAITTRFKMLRNVLVATMLFWSPWQSAEKSRPS